MDTTTILIDRGSMVRNSPFKVLCASSATAPAISTPVAPPPTITVVKHRRLSAASEVFSAVS
jgi:hypothetical protein